jgi:hypothetical protein
VEQLLLLAAFLLVGLVNYLVRWLQRRSEEAEAPPEDAPRVPAPREVPPVVVRERPDVVVTPLPPRARVRLPEPVVAIPPPPRPEPARPAAVAARRRLHPLLGRPTDLRHAIVLATVLGPCRAQEPDGR